MLCAVLCEPDRQGGVGGRGRRCEPGGELHGIQEASAQEDERRRRIRTKIMSFFFALT